MDQPGTTKQLMKKQLMTKGRNPKINSKSKEVEPNKCLNILLVGEEAAGIQTLRMLAGSSHRVVAVASSPSGNTKVATLWNVAGKMEYIRFPAHLVNQPEFSEQVIAHEVDLILNIHSLFIMHTEVINACRIGAFNMHPGPLPEYAGLNIPNWAIYHGESEHAVTIHQMVSQIDAGTIAYQKRIPIEADDTGMTLMLKCVREGIPLIQRLLDAAAQGADPIPRMEQALSRRRFFFGKAPNDGVLCWHRSAQEIVNHVRAADYSPFASPWGHPENVFNGRKVGVIRARLTSDPSEAEPGTIGQQHHRGVFVAAENEWVLVESLSLEGQSIPAHEVLRTGDRLEEGACRRCS
jgi:methionyl-tRNA formyltransferase